MSHLPLPKSSRLVVNIPDVFKGFILWILDKIERGIELNEVNSESAEAKNKEG